MQRWLILCGLILMPVLAPPLAKDGPADEDVPQKSDPLRSYYGKASATLEFFRDAEKKQPLKFVQKPVMKWASDNDWSGDVFVWTWEDRPEIIGCMLSGPSDNKQRTVFQEFHLLATDPIAPADMHGRTRWAPQAGLSRLPVKDAPQPGESPVARLTQMRQILRDFSAHMQADSEWELRLLPQPLMRYQPKSGPVIDGALFTFVWTTGTDPELVLLLECRKTDAGTAWFYAPVRFSNRELWLKHREQEVWRGPVHNEPQLENRTTYTTHYRETIEDPRSEATK